MAGHIIDTMLFDLDGVLTPERLTRSVPHRVSRFAVKHLGYDPATAPKKCAALYAEHGTNLEGFLHQGDDVDFDLYHREVHGYLPYKDVLKPRPDLRDILNALPSAKFVFTNADRAHAETCLAYMGLTDCFLEIIGFEDLQQRYQGRFTACKPKDAAMRIALDIAETDPFKTLFFDDTPRNIHMGMDHGVRSILIGDRGLTTCEYFRQLDSLDDLPVMFPLYFDDDVLLRHS